MAKEPKKRGFWGRLFKNKKDPDEKLVNGLTIDQAVDLAARHAYMQSDEYKRQQLADMIIRNQEALTKRTIEQAMTWLYPRFEDKLDDIIDELKNK